MRSYCRYPIQSGTYHYIHNMTLCAPFRKAGGYDQFAGALLPARMALEDCFDITPCR
jgi:hypothetical protein